MRCGEIPTRAPLCVPKKLTQIWMVFGEFVSNALNGYNHPTSSPEFRVLSAKLMQAFVLGTEVDIAGVLFGTGSVLITDAQRNEVDTLAGTLRCSRSPGNGAFLKAKRLHPEPLKPLKGRYRALGPYMTFRHASRG